MAYDVNNPQMKFLFHDNTRINVSGKLVDLIDLPVNKLAKAIKALEAQADMMGRDLAMEAFCNVRSIMDDEVPNWRNLECVSPYVEPQEGGDSECQE